MDLYNEDCLEKMKDLSDNSIDKDFEKSLIYIKIKFIIWIV